ncbi:arginine metabolism regulation protein ii [Fusarium langsethiae]|uniref:Arginine metabolism regulation protein ii n=1 Tax=Fusarium langsethiae TaxID=179993 RepID=A0A0N0V4Q0_FUSLA|nr:arginine metabolism regulation protein ii [Fusarium langsethiae]
MLLGIIEDLECQGQDIKTVHMKGIALLFERVGQKVLSNISSSLYGWIFVHLQVPSLITEQKMECLVIPEAQMDKSNPLMRLALVVAHCGDFYRAAKRITSSNKPPITPAEQCIMLVKLLEKGLAITEQLHLAEKETMPPTLKPQQNTDKRSLIIGGQLLAAFSSQWTACTWCFFSSCLIFFFTMVYKCSISLLALRPSYDQEKKLAETALAIAEVSLKKTTQIFCSALPYVFGEVDARGRPLAIPRRQIAVMYHMVWPLSVAIASIHSTPRQVEICQMRLDMIRDLYGIKLAWYATDLARDLMT